jgi:sulfur relay (sulfurtransferase) complex TusBCD TusD component (DsrE family)
VLDVQPFTVNDPNVASAVQHHYCASCAANRGLAAPAATIAGWEATPVPTSQEDETAR